MYKNNNLSLKDFLKKYTTLSNDFNQYNNNDLIINDLIINIININTFAKLLNSKKCKILSTREILLYFF